MYKGRRYIFSSATDAEEIFKDLSLSYKVEQKKVITKELFIYDTFDWKIFARGFFFVCENGKYKFLTLSGSDKSKKFTLPSIRKPVEYFRSSDLPVSIKKTTSIRALLIRASIILQREPINIINSNSELIFKAYIERIFYNTDASLNKVLNCLFLPEKSKYKDDLNYINDLLQRYRYEEIKDSLINHLFHIQSIFPGRYSPKINLRNLPHTKAKLAKKDILLLAVENIKANIPGIKKDLDTEFLHDFRTSVRRLRAAVDLLKNLFPENTDKKLRENFAYFQKISNELRDNDVYLLEKKKFLKLVSAKYKGELNKFFKYLEAERLRNHKSLVKTFESEKFNSIISDIEIYLSSIKDDTIFNTKHADTPIKQLADKFLAKCFARAMASGKKLQDCSPDEDVHKFRIQMKKFRYLIEFFSNYYPSGKITNILSKLKAIQDNLGSFNDLSVQIEKLEYYKNIAGEISSSPAKLSKALSEIRESKIKLKDNIRKEFNNLLQEFISQGNTEIFISLFI